MFNKIQIGQNISKFAKKKQLSLRQLARAVECSHGTIINMTLGEFKPDILRLVRIARALDVDLYTLAGIDITTFMTVQQTKAYNLGQRLMDECDGLTEKELQMSQQEFLKTVRRIKREKNKKI